jgi:hypothetical protein
MRYFKRTSLLLVLLPVMLYIAGPWYLVRAGDLNNRSVRITSSRPGLTVSHHFRFDIATAGTLGSILFEYCENSPVVGAACTDPPGFSALSASLMSQVGETGFSMHPNSSNTRVILTRTPAAAAATTVAYALDNIVNPTTPRRSNYVRITTYASDDATGTRIDNGSVVFGITGDPGIGTSVYVPPFLTFCTGVSVAPDCSSASGDRLDLGELSTLEPSFVTSQFAGATNDVNGYVTSLVGTTMTSGTNIIDPLTIPTPSIPGTAQYGINLRANVNPVVGQNPLGAGTAAPAAPYNSPDLYSFTNGTLTSSPISSDFNTFTVSYIVNVPLGQPPGIYSTTITYIAVAQF